MKKFIGICLIFLLTFSLSACPGLQRGDDPALLATADFGQYPDLENLEQILRADLRRTLFDPDSLRDLEIKKPKQSWYRRMGFRQPVIYGYETRVFFNAKNRMGGYTGLQKYFLFIRNGKTIRFVSWKEWCKFSGVSEYSPDNFDTMPEKMAR